MRQLLAAVLMFVALSPAAAQEQCGSRESILAAIAENYQERLVVMGLTTGGNLFEVFASPAGTWTAIVSPPGSLFACIVQAGTDWEKPPGKDA